MTLSPPRRLPRIFLLLALPFLSACVMFERAPAELSCDPALAGRWIPLPGNDQDALPLGRDDYAQVDAQCRVTLRDAAKQVGSQFNALGFEVEGQRYLALSQDDMRELFDDRKPPATPSKLPASSVLLVKYRLAGDVLELALPEMSYAMQQVKQGTLAARETDTMVYLVEGDAGALRKVLAAHPGLFERFDPASRNLRMRRAAAEATP